MRPESTKPRKKQSTDALAVEPTSVSPLVAGVGAVLGAITAKAMAAIEPAACGELCAAHAVVPALLALVVALSVLLGRRAGQRAATWLVLAFEIGMIGMGALSVTSRVVDRAEVVMENPIALHRAVDAPRAA